jgi:hypothetical protein
MFLGFPFAAFYARVAFEIHCIIAQNNNVDILIPWISGLPMTCDAPPYQKNFTFLPSETQK